ncbi:MAG: AMP-binding protein [Gammaproteobacteria bacterium]
MKNRIYKSFNSQQTLFSALIHASKEFGGGYKILEDIHRKPVNYKNIIFQSILLGNYIKKSTTESEHVGVMLPNVTILPIVFFALQFGGRIPALLNFSSGAYAIDKACKTAEIKTIYTSRNFINKAKLNNVIDELKKKYSIFYLEDIKKNIKLKSVLRSFFIRIFIFKFYIKQDINKDPDNTAVILFTSGSEGIPKGVVLSHKNLLSNYAQVKDHIKFSKSDTVFCCLPLYHSFGLNAGFLMPLFGGAKIFLYPTPLDYRLIPDFIARLKATILFGTNTFFKGYANYANTEHFKTLKYVVAGAEKLHRDTIKLWKKKFNLNILQGYGVTETSPVISVNDLNQNKEGTVGCIMNEIEYYFEPVEGIDKGGRLVVKGPNIMLGYLLHNEPGLLKPPSSSRGLGWHDTGDIADIDQEGFITILGRAKRFAKIGGEMVSLTAVEELAVLAWPEQKHACVSITDQNQRERIILITENKKANLKELQDVAAKNHISSFNIPKKIETKIDIPVLATGKIDYMSLKKLVSETE